ncbi:hypothetical protein CSUB01_06119 [Colletotrichum sublineola]|uniref:Uncharacterized protein n=1 Tax=Colletotrichum sublineola TaxID=1173701 RepID=A0A066XKG6_COLSU|nr:hypothetical protein CSUB01_06119 [Colletotrichum sublineola]
MFPSDVRLVSTTLRSSSNPPPSRKLTARVDGLPGRKWARKQGLPGHGRAASQWRSRARAHTQTRPCTCSCGVSGREEEEEEEEEWMTEMSRKSSHSESKQAGKQIRSEQSKQREPEQEERAAPGRACNVGPVPPVT